MTSEVSETKPLGLNIITFNNPDLWPLLQVPSQDCSLPITEKDLEVINGMKDTLTVLGDSAIGLAAIQVGYPKQIFILRIGDQYETFINPVILSRSQETKKLHEACLSLPGIVVRINRPKTVKLQYFDTDGNLKTNEFKGLLAQAVMHEIEHLNGQLISRDLENQLKKTQRRSKFGMILNDAAKLRIANRRRKNKCARKTRKKQRCQN